MNMMFWGLILLFLDIKIGIFSITPAFIGYILICIGMAEQSELKEVSAFTRARPWAIAGAVLTAVFWFPWSSGWVSVFAAAAGIALQFTVTYFIAMGVKELEERERIDLKSGRLRAAWCALAVSSVLSLLLSWLGSLLAILAVFAMLAAAIVYLVAFHLSKQALYWRG